MRDKPFSFLAAQEQARRVGLDFPALDRFAASGRPLDWTPAIVGTTDPTYGTGGSRLGKYVRMNGMGAAYWSISFGTGSTFGSGVWKIGNLPFNVCSLYNAGVGKGINVCGMWFGNSATQYSFGPVVVDNTTSFSAYPYYLSAYPVGTLTALTPTQPWTWADGFSFSGYVVGPLTDGFNPT